MPEPYGYTIFCDDIRDEIGGKTSLMGRYVGSMNIGAAAPPPGETLAFAKFAAATQIVAPKEYEVAHARIALTLDQKGQPPQLLAEVNIDPPDLADTEMDLKMFGVNFIVAPLLLPGNCLLRVRGYLDGREVKAGSLQVLFHPPAASSPSPP